VTRDRNFEGLNAILEVLEAAELERDQNGEQPLLGEHVVCGLLIAARQLTAAIVAAGGKCHALA